MQGPTVRNAVVDRANNFTYHILAYRRLSRTEMYQAVAVYRAQPSVRRRKHPPRNGSVTIHTEFGATY